MINQLQKIPSASVAWIAILLLVSIARGQDGNGKNGSRVKNNVSSQQKLQVGILLFPRFEMLDAAGPMEVWGNLGQQVNVLTVAARREAIPSAQGPKILVDADYESCPKLDLLLIPRGFGVQAVLKDEATLAWIRKKASEAQITMSVCNGASLLAATGLLDDRKATTNKAYWKMATAPGPNVNWVPKARWVDDGDIVTSSGVSAGIDMSLNVVERLFGTQRAERVANMMEYEWHRDSSFDPFAELHGLK